MHFKMNKILKTQLITGGVFFIITLHFILSSVYYHNNKSPNEKLADSFSSGYGLLLLLYLFYVFGLTYVYIIKPHLIPYFSLRLTSWKSRRGSNRSKHVSIIINTIILACCIGFVIYDSWYELERLISLVGLFMFLVFGYAISSNRSQIQWRIVLSGLSLQFIFGILSIRWDIGRNVFEEIGKKLEIFFSFADEGSAFVYGDFLVRELKVMAFQGMTIVFFLNFIINILYYYGIIQSILSSFGQFLQWIMGTSICESVNSATNIFLGLGEAPFMLKPYLKLLTHSELNSIMTSGFATISGSLFAIWVTFGANSSDLITSSIMSAPAALCYSKLMYPETEEVEITKDNTYQIESEFESVLSAACKGATDAFYIIAGVISSLIAFVAFSYFINAFLTWYGEFLGFVDPNSHWTVTLALTKIFTPISFLMGVPWDECEKVAELIGLRTGVNNMVAFKELGLMNLTERTKTIATFSICGFTNIPAIGITIATFGMLAPSKKEVIMKLVPRAFVGGGMVCLMTACIAGALTSTVSK